MKSKLLLLAGLLYELAGNAQVTSDQVDLGAGYINQVYYHFNGNKSSMEAATWDLGFSTNLMDGAVIANPATISVYRIAGADSSDYAGITDTAGLNLVYQYNSDTAWIKGAFNVHADAMNPFDFGWGVYDFATHKVLATSIFIVKKGNSYYKLWIRSKEANGDSHVRYAMLNGSPDEDAVISTTNYGSKNFVYLSLSSPSQLDIEPATTDWHLFFGRYVTEVEGLGSYPVTGLLTNVGTETAEARGVDWTTASYVDYEGSYSSNISEIGYDWKYFDLGIFQYVIVDSLIYFVKTSTGSIHSIRFIDFNSTTGVVSFDTEQLLTAVASLPSTLHQAAVYPNPASANVTLVYDALASADVTAALYDLSGKEVLRRKFEARAGLNTEQLALSNLASGMYHLVLDYGSGKLPLKVMIER